MGLFPDDFPFSKRQGDAEPVVEATPLAPSSVFPPGFPFNDNQPAPAPHPESVPADAAPAADAPPIEETYEDPEPIAPLAAPAAAPPFKERRRSPRQRMRAKATLRVDNVGGNPINVELDNLSLLGVRFRADCSLLLNDKANIRLEVGPLKWNARLRVINCLPGSNGMFTIGCEFVGNELARGRAAA